MNARVSLATLVFAACLPVQAQDHAVPTTSSALVAAGARRLDAGEIRALATGKLLVTQGRTGLTESQLNLRPDGTLSGSISGSDGTSNGWGKWWIADAGFLCLDVKYGFGWSGRSCFALYSYRGKFYSSPRKGPTNTEPPPDAPVVPREFR